MFFKIIFFGIILWSNLTFSSGKDIQNTQSVVVSQFYENIDYMKNFLSLSVSILKPDGTSKTSTVTENTLKWLKGYMPRFYSVKTNFKHIDSIIQTISRDNSTIDAEYKAIKSIQWDNTNITYGELQTNLANLVQFYEKYKTVIEQHASCTLQSENKTPSLVSNNAKKTPQNIKPQPGLNKNTGNNYKLIIAKLKNYKDYIVIFLKDFCKYITNKLAQIKII